MEPKSLDQIFDLTRAELAEVDAINREARLVMERGKRNMQRKRELVERLTEKHAANGWRQEVAARLLFLFADVRIKSRK